ncbi:hypothetical protein V1477_013796 [Vespula maculifrons]|uniref:Uncharacterized protein n=1 Tax=Vespula maculifrons TaxID=7453 RepID=A0ABD2BPA7_VESMC
MKKIRYRIKCDWEILQNKPELKILKKYAEVSRRCTIIIAICFYLYAAFLIFPSALRNFRYIFGSMSYTELTLPFYVEYFMKNQMKYYFGLFVEYVIIIIGSTIGIANYSMFIAVIQHACALFSIVEWRVNERFRKPPENFYYANNKNELAEEIEWIVDIIQNYNKAINCQIPFYSLSLSTQKLLPLLIMKSMRKCSLSLTSAIVISHDLFAKGFKHYVLIEIFLNSQYENHYPSL